MIKPRTLDRRERELPLVAGICAELDGPVDADGVEQPAIVRDEQQRAVVRLEGLLELFDRGEVEVVGSVSSSTRQFVAPRHQ